MNHTKYTNQNGHMYHFQDFIEHPYIWFTNHTEKATATVAQSTLKYLKKWNSLFVTAAFFSTTLLPAIAQAQTTNNVVFINAINTPLVLVHNNNQYQLHGGGGPTSQASIDLIIGDTVDVYMGIPDNTRNGVLVPDYSNQRESVVVTTSNPQWIHSNRYRIEDLSKLHTTSNDGPSVSAAFRGYDIRKFEMANLSAAQTDHNIFQPLSERSTRYVRTNETLVPVGCYQDAINHSGVSTHFEESYSRESATSSWGLSLGVGFPLKAVAKAKVGLGFGGRSEQTETFREYFKTRQSWKDKYWGHCDPNRDDNGIFGGPFPWFDITFLNDLSNLTEANVGYFVNKYGTHYAKKVVYGGLSASISSTTEDSFYKAKEFNVDISATIEKNVNEIEKWTTNAEGTSGQSWTDVDDEDDKHKGSPTDFNTSFNYTKKNETEESFKLHDSQFYQTGTEGRLNDGTLNVTNDSARPIRINWGRLDTLIKAEYLNSVVPNVENKREWIKSEIDRILNELNDSTSRDVTRGYIVNVKAYRVTGSDDKDWMMSGKIDAQVSSSTQSVTVWDICNHEDKHTGGGKCWVDRRLVKGAKFTKTDYIFEQEGKRTVDANGVPQYKFDPLTLTLRGHLIDGDVGALDDRADFSVQYVLSDFELNPSEGIVTLIEEVNHWATAAEWTRWHVETKIKPMLTPGNAPQRFSSINPGSAPQGSGSINNQSRSATTLALELPVVDVPAPQTHYLSSVLDPEFYIKRYPDLHLNSNDAAANHWLQVGIREGRQSSEFFNLSDYVENNNDIKKQFGNDYLAALHHWLEVGRYSKPIASPTSTPNDITADVKSMTVKYGAEHHLQNMYQTATSYLDVRNFGTEPGSLYAVSTAATPTRDTSGTGTWRFVPRNGAQNGEPLRYGDEVHIQNKYSNWASYLDINSGGCEGNVYCVSAASSPNRDVGTAVWRVLSANEQKPAGSEVLTGDDIHLEVSYNSNSTYLDIRESGCDGNLYCVSTANSPTRDSSGTGTWRIQ